MDKHISNDPNNPINCTEELNLCKTCQTEKEKDLKGEEYCSWCDLCQYCEEYLDDCNCIDTNNIKIILGL